MAPLTFKLKFTSTELTVFHNSTQLEPSWLSLHHFTFTLTLFCNRFELCTVSRIHCPVSCLQAVENGVPAPWNPLNSFYHTSFCQSILYHSVQILSSLKLFLKEKSCHNTLYLFLSQPSSYHVVIVGDLPALTLVELLESKLKIQCLIHLCSLGV